MFPFSYRFAAAEAKKVLDKIGEADFPVSADVAKECPQDASLYQRSAGAARLSRSIMGRHTLTHGRGRQDANPKLREIAPIPRKTASVMLECQRFLTWWVARAHFKYLKIYAKNVEPEMNIQPSILAAEEVFKVAFVLAEERANLASRRRKEEARLQHIRSEAVRGLFRVAISNATWLSEGYYNEAQNIAQIINLSQWDFVGAASQ